MGLSSHGSPHACSNARVQSADLTFGAGASAPTPIPTRAPNVLRTETPPRVGTEDAKSGVRTRGARRLEERSPHASSYARSKRRSNRKRQVRFSQSKRTSAGEGVPSADLPFGAGVSRWGERSPHASSHARPKRPSNRKRQVRCLQNKRTSAGEGVPSADLTFAAGASMLSAAEAARCFALRKRRWWWRFKINVLFGGDARTSPAHDAEEPLSQRTTLKRARSRLGQARSPRARHKVRLF